MLDEVQVLENKNKVIELLKSTKRDNIDNVIEYLENNDFFTAPASTVYHENYTGGLCYHSLKVLEVFTKLEKTLNIDIPEDSKIIMCLLHDICKINIYHKEKKNVKIGQNWQTVDYWKFDDFDPIGHGHKSVILLLELGLKLSKLERDSIIAHMSSYDKSDYFNPSNVYNNDNKSALLHIADFTATYIFGDRI